MEYNINAFNGIETKNGKIFSLYVGDSRAGGIWYFQEIPGQMNMGLSSLEDDNIARYLFETIENLPAKKYREFVKDVGMKFIRNLEKKVKE